MAARCCLFASVPRWAVISRNTQSLCRNRHRERERERATVQRRAFHCQGGPHKNRSESGSEVLLPCAIFRFPFQSVPASFNSKEAKIRTSKLSVKTSAVLFTVPSGPLVELELSATSGCLMDENGVEKVRNVESVFTGQA